MITDATHINLFRFPYTLLKVDQQLLEEWGIDDSPGAVRLVFQCFYPEEMMFYFTSLDDYEAQKGNYYLFDVARMEMIHCYKDTALRALKRAKQQG